METTYTSDFEDRNWFGFYYQLRATISLVWESGDRPLYYLYLVFVQVALIN